MQCVILAGGLGTRMAGLTAKIPKALIPVNGHPFVRYQIQWLKKCGVSRLTFSLGHMGDQIQSYVEGLGDQGLKFDFVMEEKELLGTGGALRYAFDLGVLEEKFLVLYGDSYLPLDASAVWKRFQDCGLPAMITVFKNHSQFDRSNAHYAQGLVPFYSKEKPYSEPLTYIDYGMSALRSDLIAESIPKGQKFDLAKLFETLSLKGRLAGFEVFERFYEIGSPQGLAEFSDYAKTHLTRF